MGDGNGQDPIDSPSPDVRIIQCGSLCFFTTPLPPGPETRLMGDAVEQELGSTELIVGDDYFALLFSRPKVRITEAAMQHRIISSLEAVWRELYDRGVVDTPRLPEIIQGNVRMMLPDHQVTAPTPA
jgi:hypothetical protein